MNEAGALSERPFLDRRSENNAYQHSGEITLDGASGKRETIDDPAITIYDVMHDRVLRVESGSFFTRRERPTCLC
jgi:hypothetical protein